MFPQITTKLLQKTDLTQKEITFFLEKSIQQKLSLTNQAVFLSLLQSKGLSATELSFFVNFLREKTTPQLTLPQATDIVGTGGSGLDRINTSTISTFILSSLDVPIAKHGNKAASGRFGSFDLLENLDINIEISPEKNSYTFWQENLTFLYARTFHGAFKHFAQVRQELGFPTVFNLLGPLLNPAGATNLLIGTTFTDKMELMLKTCQKLHKKHVMVVCGSDGLDEITLTGPTKILEISSGKIKKYTIKPQDFGVKPCSFANIAGGDQKTNTKIAQQILQNQCKTRHLDLVLINCAAVLKMLKKCQTLKEGYQIAKKAITSGQAYEKLQNYQKLSHQDYKIQEIVGNKFQFLQKKTKKFPKKTNTKKPPSFLKALQKPGLNLIAEVKKASPSQGLISQKNFDPKKIAKIYEKNNASAISVLCEENYFQGSLTDLQKVSQAVKIPVLCKDFIIQESQISAAYHYGASAILLIASILSTAQIKNFIQKAAKLGLEALVEIHNATELEKALAAKAQIIGINNRDLKTLQIDLKTTQKLVPKIPSNIVIVSESGLQNKKDLLALPRQVNAVLIGTSLMQSNSLEKKLLKFTRCRQTLKICGIRNTKEAQYCEKLGIDFIGLNFVPTSKRKITEKKAANIIKHCHHTKTVGVFQNQDLNFVNNIAQKLKLDYIQLSGQEDLSYVQKCVLPVIKTISLKNMKNIKEAEKFLPEVAFILFDGVCPGSGQEINYKLLKSIKFPYLIAGGINENNIRTILKNTNPIGIDLASGVEEKGVISLSKIKKIFANL